jgi:hypothetical protein
MLQRKKIPRDCGAFTLVEVALAASVLLFAIVSAFQIVAAGTRMLDFSRKQTLATQIIHAEIDHVRLCTWSTVNGWASSNANRTITLSALDSTFGDTNASTTKRFGYPELMTFKTAVSAEMATTGFTVQRVVSYVTGRTDMVQIVFTVTWQAKVFSEATGTGHTYSRQGTTYFGKNGLSSTYQRS